MESGTESTQGSEISKRKVPEMPILSEPELELSRSNSKRDKSHSEGSDRQIYEPVKAVLHSVQGKRLQNVYTNPPRSDELLAHPQKAPQRGENSEILQWMQSTIIKTSNPKDKRLAQKKEGGKQGRSPSSFYQHATSQPTPHKKKKKKKKDWRKPYYPSYSMPRIQKASVKNVFNMARILREFKDKEEQRMRQPHFPKKYIFLLML
ncbi:hypothetical protein O181_118451 [Austropuccinia psidii MF-1]|uniref:Uncharacterized protein n=1 Tax=Austropuccinia psidii MF-1 TaxID=1389203 RepID=A0A9Q3PYU5_9BASI|nr:hypothetical protein [Austropuccinia psidii MF-1]